MSWNKENAGNRDCFSEVPQASSQTYPTRFVGFCRSFALKSWWEVDFRWMSCLKNHSPVLTEATISQLCITIKYRWWQDTVWNIRMLNMETSMPRSAILDNANKYTAAYLIKISRKDHIWYSKRCLHLSSRTFSFQKDTGLLLEYT